MKERIVARGYGRLLAERWKGPYAATRVVEFTRANPGDCPRVAIVLSLADQPQAREDRRGGRSSGRGRGGQSHGFWTKVRKDPALAPGGCWLWTGYIAADGSGKFCTLRSGRQVTLRTHIEAWRELRGELRDPKDWSLLSICGRSDCVNPDHREWIERTALTRRLHQLGRSFEWADNKGEMCGRAVLTEEDVLFIRLQAQVRGSMPLLARLYGVSYVTIGQVKYGKTWTHLGKRRAGITELLTLRQLRGLVEDRAQDKVDLAEQRASAPTARTGSAA